MTRKLSSRAWSNWLFEGESFVIAKAGKPMVKVIALDAAEPAQMRRFGFMAGQVKIPADVDRMSAPEIEALFEGPA